MSRRFIKYPSKSVTANTQSSSLANDVTRLLAQSDNMIAQFRDAGREFDPYDALTGNEDMSQLLYSASVNFQADIQEAVDKYRDATTFNVSLRP